MNERAAHTYKIWGRKVEDVRERVLKFPAGFLQTETMMSSDPGHHDNSSKMSQCPEREIGSPES